MMYGGPRLPQPAIDGGVTVAYDGNYPCANRPRGPRKMEKHP